MSPQLLPHFLPSPKEYTPRPPTLIPYSPLPLPLGSCPSHTPSRSFLEFSSLSKVPLPPPLAISFAFARLLRVLEVGLTLNFPVRQRLNSRPICLPEKDTRRFSPATLRSRLHEFYYGGSRFVVLRAANRTAPVLSFRTAPRVATARRESCSFFWQTDGAGVPTLANWKHRKSVSPTS